MLHVNNLLIRPVWPASCWPCDSLAIVSHSLDSSITTADPPDDITDINISPDTITACSFVVQWSEPSSDPVCGTVWYTVTISTERGILIITDNTTMTNYNVTGGLNDNTVYHVIVTASNNAGSSGSATTSIRTNSNGKLYIRICNCVYSYVPRCVFVDE